MGLRSSCAEYGDWVQNKAALLRSLVVVGVGMYFGSSCKGAPVVHPAVVHPAWELPSSLTTFLPPPPAEHHAYSRLRCTYTAKGVTPSKPNCYRCTSVFHRLDPSWLEEWKDTCKPEWRCYWDEPLQKAPCHPWDTDNPGAIVQPCVSWSHRAVACCKIHSGPCLSSIWVHVWFNVVLPLPLHHLVLMEFHTLPVLYNPGSWEPQHMSFF